MDLDRIRKLAGLPTESVQAPSQLTERVTHADDEALVENEKVDFSTKHSELLVMLENAISDANEEIITLSEDHTEALSDIEALGLTKVGTVVDLGTTIFNVYEDADSDLWFRQVSDAGTIQRTSMVMEDLVSFHAGEDINMRDSDATEDADDTLSEGKGKEKCKKCGQVPCKCKKDKNKKSDDDDDAPNWAAKKRGCDDKSANADGDKKRRTTIREDDNEED